MKASDQDFLVACVAEGMLGERQKLGEQRIREENGEKCDFSSLTPLVVATYSGLVPSVTSRIIGRKDKRTNNKTTSRDTKTIELQVIWVQ